MPAKIATSVVLARGVTSENESFVPHPATEILRVRPEIATDQHHQPLLSRESIAGVNVSRTRGAKEFALLRGVQPIAYEVHPNLHLRRRDIGRCAATANG